MEDTSLGTDGCKATEGCSGWGRACRKAGQEEDTLCPLCSAGLEVTLARQVKRSCVCSGGGGLLAELMSEGKA